MKKIFLIFLIGLFVMSFTSAFDWTDNTTSYYKLDGTSGVVIDELGINNGTNVGATRGVTGIINNAFDLDGINDKVNLTNAILPTGANADFGISAWIYLESYNVATGSNIFSQYYPSISGRYGFQVLGAGNLTSNGWVVSNYTVPLNEWVHVATTRDSGNVSIYINGQYNGSGTETTAIADETSFIGNLNPLDNNYIFNGSIDEVGIWNRSLTPSEVSELYNSGSGLPYNPIDDTPTITLVSPTNATTISDIGTNFTVSGNNISTANANWTNITYYVWEESSGNLTNATTINLGNVDEFNNSQFIDDFTFQDYLWNAYGCFVNVTGDFCIWADNNNTLSVSLFTIINESYVNETVAGTLENFSISIDLLEGYNLQEAIFYYNGTTETPSITAQAANRYLLVSDYQIPILSADENTTFHWSLTFDDSTNLNTTNRTQLIRAVLLDNCSVYTNEIFNISLKDEETKGPLNGNIELVYTLLNKPNYDVISTHSLNVTGVSNLTICSGLNLSSESLAYSTEIRYSATGYVSEFYHIQRQNILPIVQNISLYDLNSSDSTEFKITYQDSTFNFVEGAIIQLQRKYISEDSYQVVEAPITSADGNALLHIDLNTIKYRATVVKDGVVLDEFDNLVFKCQSELTGECDYKLLGSINPQNDQNFDNVIDFYYSEPTLSNGSIAVSFSVPSGSPSSVNVVLEQKDQFGNSTLCNRTIVSSAGSTSCNYTATLGDSYIDFYLYKDGTPIARQSYILEASSGLDWLDNNYIFMLVLLFSLVGMALTSPEWMVVNAIITLVISGGLYLANGLSFVMGLGMIAWLVIAAIILISKMAKQEDR